MHIIFAYKKYLMFYVGYTKFKFLGTIWFRILHGAIFF